MITYSHDIWIMRELIKYTKTQNIKRKSFNLQSEQLFLHGPLFELSRGSASAQLKQRSMQEKLSILKKHKFHFLQYSTFY